jgi:hypothetical protein
MRAYVEESVTMLKFLWGRGCLYMVGALLMLCLCMADTDNYVVFSFCGACMAIVAAASMFLGFGLLIKMNALKNEIESEANIDQKWSEADLDEEGQLDSKKFPVFLASLNKSGSDVPLSYNELCATIQELDSDNNGKISLVEFKIWS